MALFEYFPNYVWNLSLAIALESGGRIGEIMDMCQPLRTAAERGEDAGTPQFMRQWVAMADKLAALALEDQEAGRLYSAGEELKRAALYYTTAEFTATDSTAPKSCSTSVGCPMRWPSVAWLACVLTNLGPARRCGWNIYRSPMR